MGIIIRTYQIWVAIFILIITVLVIMQPDTGNINYELIQLILGILVFIITGIWALFSYLNNVRSKETQKVQQAAKETQLQNHDILVEQDKKIDSLKFLITSIKVPIDEKIESRKQKDIDQDKHIAENKKEIEKLQLRMKEVEKDMKELKDHVDKRFDKLEELIKELVKK